jgi:hypothetical protein
MKKVKQSKKRWARTEAQGRRDYYCQSWNHRFYHIPSWFIKAFTDSNEAIIRKAMHDLNREVNPDEVFIKTRYRAKCSAAWWWL